MAIAIPWWEKIAPIPWLGINYPQLGCFLAFWSINMLVIYLGIDSIRFLLNIKAPLLIVLGLALLGWAYYQANGFGPMLSQPSQFAPEGKKAGEFWIFFFPALTGIVGFWATLSLNIPDFTRYATSQRAQVVGQALGLPLTMALYSFIGVAVTSATMVIYGKFIWDPVEVLSLFRNPLVLTIGMVSLCLATLATNIAANVVSPANDFAHLWPRRISFRTGGLITGVAGILMQPWKLYADPTGYIFRWLVAYSGLLGAIGGILITDYYLLRRTRLDLKALYQSGGEYWYSKGFNPLAMIALVAGIAPCVPGFLGTIEAARVAPIWISLYHYAWFMSFGISAVVYAVLMKLVGGWHLGGSVQGEIGCRSSSPVFFDDSDITIPATPAQQHINCPGDEMLHQVVHNDRQHHERLRCQGRRSQHETGAVVVHTQPEHERHSLAVVGSHHTTDHVSRAEGNGAQTTHEDHGDAEKVPIRIAEYLGQARCGIGVAKDE